MTPEERARLRELCKEDRINYLRRRSISCDFVASAREALPALLDEVERLEGENAKHEAKQAEWHDKWRYCLDHLNAKTESENALLRKALAFYADESNYGHNSTSVFMPNLVGCDRGDCARKALEEGK